MKTLCEEFQVHETLNPKLWDTKSQQLLPEVRSKLVEIVSAFEDYTEAPIEIIDAQLCGSNASFNYTATSDLDLHVIANFESIDAPAELLQLIYNSTKASFNRDTDITIHGIEVELYVQDVRNTVHSNGIYSICDNKWVKEPKPIKSITKHNTEKEQQQWTEHVKEVVSSQDYDVILDCINALYLMRTNSIAVDGEYGKGNQLFKDIRNAGLLKALKDALNDSLSKKLSLESLSNGTIVNRLDESKIRKFLDKCK